MTLFGADNAGVIVNPKGEMKGNLLLSRRWTQTILCEWDRQHKRRVDVFMNIFLTCRVPSGFLQGPLLLDQLGRNAQICGPGLLVPPTPLFEGLLREYSVLEYLGCN